jgi:hypothetical protein
MKASKSFNSSLIFCLAPHSFCNSGGFFFWKELKKNPFNSNGLNAAGAKERTNNFSGTLPFSSFSDLYENFVRLKQKES